MLAAYSARNADCGTRQKKRADATERVSPGQARKKRPGRKRILAQSRRAAGIIKKKDRKRTDKDKPCNGILKRGSRSR